MEESKITSFVKTVFPPQAANKKFGNIDALIFLLPTHSVVEKPNFNISASLSFGPIHLVHAGHEYAIGAHIFDDRRFAECKAQCDRCVHG